MDRLSLFLFDIMPAHVSDHAYFFLGRVCMPCPSTSDADPYKLSIIIRIRILDTEILRTDPNPDQESLYSTRIQERKNPILIFSSKIQLFNIKKKKIVFMLIPNKRNKRNHKYLRNIKICKNELIQY